MFFFYLFSYSNNPDSTTGYAGLYALAIFAQSSTIGVMALLSQLCQFAIVRFVEMPHVDALYGKDARDSGALWETIKVG